MSNKLIHDEHINALRQYRETTDDMLASISSKLLADRHTIQALEARIKELEDQSTQDREDYDHLTAKYDDLKLRYNTMVDHADKLENKLTKGAHPALSRAHRRTVETAKNVTRLTRAAISHMDNGRNAVAKQLLLALDQLEGEGVWTETHQNQPDVTALAASS